MKNCVIKILATIVLSILFFNYIGKDVLAVQSQALDDSFIVSRVQIAEEQAVTVGNAEAIKQEDGIISQITNQFSTPSGVLDGVIGILYSGFLIYFPLAIGLAAQSLTSAVANSAGSLDDKATVNIVGPDQILFNRLAITDINFLDLNSFGSGSQKKALDTNGENNPVKIIRKNIAQWYYALRTIALIVLLCILIYVGIRMALTSVAEEKAVYKKWLGNWVVSMALLFVLHYLILVVINVNNSLVDVMYNARGVVMGDNNNMEFFSNYLSSLLKKAFTPLSALSGVSATMVYIGIVAMTFIFLIMYIKRMLVVAFLTLIAPIITVTYSVDKLKDGTSQALNTWFRTFMENVLIQPFHCIIYLVFVGSAINCIKTTGTLAAGMLCIMSLFFLLSAEGIIKKIFGISANETGGMGVAAGAMMGLMNRTKDVTGRAAGKAKGVASNVTKKDSKSATELSSVNTNKLTASNTAKQNMGNIAMQGTSRGTSNNANSKQIYGPNGDVISTVVESTGAQYGIENGLNTASQLSLSGEEEIKNNSSSNRMNVIFGPNGRPISISQAEGSTPTIPKIVDIPIENSQVLGQDEDTKVKGPEEKRTLKNKALNMAKTAGRAYVYTAGVGMKTSMALMGATVAGVAGKDAGEVAGSALLGYHIGDNMIETAKAMKEVAENSETVQKAQDVYNSYIKSENKENEELSAEEQMDNFMEQRKIRQSQEELAKSYEDYKKEHFVSDNQMKSNARAYQKMSNDEINNIKDKTAKNYAKAVKNTTQIFEEAGVEDSYQQMDETLERIKAGEFNTDSNKTSEDVKEQKVEQGESIKGQRDKNLENTNERDVNPRNYEE